MSIFETLERVDSLIKFECPSCSREFRVEQHRAGERGRCPGCGSIFKVPKSSIDTFESIGDVIFESKKMNELYQKFLEEHEDIVIQEVGGRGKLSGKMILLELATDIGRSQLVSLAVMGEDDEEYVWIRSNVGEILDDEDYLIALRIADETINTFSLAVNEDHEMFVRCFRKLKNFDGEEFSSSIVELAIFADQLEEKLLGSDHH